MASLQLQLWLQQAGILKESKEKITRAEIKKILQDLEKEKGWHEGDKDDEEENEKKHLNEAKTAKPTEGPEKGKVSSDTKGKLHELLVGYHLNGGSHMSQHPDREGDTPKQAHDKLKKSIHPDDYKKINARAKSAAEDVRKKVEVGGHIVHSVHWTSKPGDIQRSTGIKSSQKEDSSDVVVTTKNKKKQQVHHGVSLKVTDSSNKHVPVSNPGEKTFHGADKHLEAHRTDILQQHPELKHAGNREARKAMMKANPKMKDYVKKKNAETLHNVAKTYHEHLSNLPKHELADHIRHLMHSHQTPMQQQGHNHIRHTTYSQSARAGGGYGHHSIVPSAHHEHIYNDPHNIEIHHSGSSIHFKHKGKTFGRVGLKFSSQSDPLSSIKGSGQTAGD
jgi:hypothetical protein